MPVSLAPFRYRSILGTGPLSRLESGPSSLWDGTACFDAAAELKAELRTDGLPQTVLYSQADGGGTHRSAVIARHIAISEALERWAFYTCSTAPSLNKGLFGIDDSTTGMAAFPGITTAAARQQATREAIERWAILEWWRGTLPAVSFKPLDPRISGIEIMTPFRAWHVVILWADCEPGAESRAYGFSAAKDRLTASNKALIELTRNSRALANYRKLIAKGDGSAINLVHPYERRLAYFSSRSGAAIFQARVAASGAPGFPIRVLPERIVDEEIQGPWSKYATVWRVLFRHSDGPEIEYHRPDVFYF